MKKKFILNKETGQLFPWNQNFLNGISERLVEVEREIEDGIIKPLQEKTADEIDVFAIDDKPKVPSIKRRV